MCSQNTRKNRALVRTGGSLFTLAFLRRRLGDSFDHFLEKGIVLSFSRPEGKLVMLTALVWSELRWLRRAPAVTEAEVRPTLPLRPFLAVQPGDGCVPETVYLDLLTWLPGQAFFPFRISGVGGGVHQIHIVEAQQ